MNFYLKSQNTLISISFLFLLFFSHQSLFAQQPAFPTAYGAGAYTTGGRGGIVVHITNLNASGPGSFAAALLMTVPRTIVFDVSGIISINKLLYVGKENSDFTIAGQTTPEGGITIAGGRVYFSGVTNYIMRHIRFKGGFEADWVPNTADNLGSASFSALGDINQTMIDHVSFGFAPTMPTWVKQGNKPGIVDKTTIQRSFFSESVKGAIIGQDVDNTPYYLSGDMTFSKNVFYNTRYRTPNTTGNHGPGKSFDIINNLTWQAQGRMTRSSGDTNINQLNNATYHSVAPITDQNLNLYSEGWKPKIYTSGNLIVAPNVRHSSLKNTIDEMNADNTLSWKHFVGSRYGEQLPRSFFTRTPYPIRGLHQTILDAKDLRLILPEDVGCNARLNADGSVSLNLDTHDTEYLNNIKNNVMVKPLDVYKLDPIPSISRPSNFYINNPHIPEIWFAANVPKGQGHNDIAPSGYTWLEEYLNQVDRPKNVVTVKDVEITPEEADLEISKTLQLSATFTPANATNQNGIWTSSNKDIATVDSKGLVTAVSEGVVKITFKSAEGGVESTSEITVLPEALHASAGNDQEICEGSSATLTATGGATYRWENGSTTASITVSPSESTTYKVTVYDSTGKNSDTDEVTVKVSPLPIVNAGKDITINSGESTTLTATGASTYKWSTGAASASITVRPTASQTYKVTGTSNGCEAIDTVTITVLNPVGVTADAGADQAICEGSSTILTATGGSTYLWSTGAKTASITVSPNETKLYEVTAYDNTGKKSDSDEVTVKVSPLPIVNAGKDITINSGESATLTATGASTYKWGTGAASASITVRPTASQTYKVTGTRNGCEVTDTVRVTVLNPVGVTADAGADQTICAGSSATLTATGGSAYLWNTGEKTASITVSPNQTTPYTLTAFDSTGKNSDTDEVTVTVNPLPVVNAGNNITINSGESTTLTATGASTYMWSTGASSASITVSPTATHTYTVTGSRNGCEATSEVTVTVKNPLKVKANAGGNQDICKGSNVKLTATGGDTYLWSTGAKTQSITVNPNSTTKYSVTAYVGNTSGTAEAVVNVSQTPNVKITNGSEASILEGEFITLSATGAKSYKWNNGATQPNIAVRPNGTQTYSVTGHDNKCSADKSIKVNVFEKVVASAGSDITMYRNENTVLTATGPKNTQFLWSTGETTKSITVSPMEDTEYSVMVYHDLDSDTANVIVKVIDLVDDNVMEDSNPLEFLIHPNPTDGELNIKISGLTNLSSIHLYDLSGKLLYNEIINESDHQSYNKTLNLSNYATGIYLLQLLDNQRVITKKVVVR